MEELRCGIDLVAVDRIVRLGNELSADAMARIFGAEELAACQNRRFPERHLAERFAAKEACLKLFPMETATGDLGAEDIDVIHSTSPVLHLRPGERLCRVMERHGVKEIAISTSSSRTQACALAVVMARSEAVGQGRIVEELEQAAGAVRALEPSFLGRLMRCFLPIRHNVIQANMRRVFGESLSQPEYRKLTEAFYQNMARFVLDTLVYTFKPSADVAKKVRVENIEIPIRAAEAGNGVIILTGHFGSWESACAAGILQFSQYRGKFHFLRRPISTRWIETLVLRRFLRAGLRVIPKKNSLFPILDLLHRNEVLVFIMDQHASVPKDGIAVDFFGEKAGTFRSLALIAKASGATVIPAHGWREKNGNHVLRFEEPLSWLDDEDPTREIAINTRAYNHALEKMVLRHPEQWFWMHKRWKLRQ